MRTGDRGWTAFRRLWAATAAANVADGFLLAAVPLIALTLTRDPLLIAGLAAMQYVPWLLFSLPVGVLADLGDRTRLMRIANLVRVATLVCLTVLALLGFLSLPVLYVAVLIMGLAETLYDNTSSAVVPSIVDDDVLERANGRLQATYTLGNSFVGPPLGGLLFGLAVAAPLAFGAGGYTVALVLLLFLPSLRAQRSAETGGGDHRVLSSMAEGWRIFRGSRSLVSLCVLAGVGNAVSAAAYGLLPLLLVEQLGAPSSVYGLVLAGGAVGAVSGGWLGDRVAARVPPGAILLGTTVASGLTVACFAVVPNPVLLAALMAVDGFIVMTQSVVLVSSRARLIPDAAMGRVTALFRSLSMGAAVVGGLAGGLLAKFTTINLVFAIGGALLVVLAVALSRPLRTARLRAEIADARA